MTGRHKFTRTTAGSVCEHCGKTKEYLDARRIEGKLPICPDAPENEQPQGTPFFIHYLIKIIDSCRLYLFLY
jgi:glutaredoxin